MQRFTESPAQHTHQITHKTNDIGNVQGVRHKGAIIEAHVIRTNIMHPLILSHYVCMRHTKHTSLSFCLNPFFWSMYIHTRPGGGDGLTACVDSFAGYATLITAETKSLGREKLLDVSLSTLTRLLRSSMAEIQFECSWKHWISAISGAKGEWNESFPSVTLYGSISVEKLKCLKCRRRFGSFTTRDRGVKVIF